MEKNRNKISDDLKKFFSPALFKIEFPTIIDYDIFQSLRRATPHIFKIFSKLSMNIYLLTESENLHAFRCVFEPLGYPIIGSCSLNALLSACIRGNGCIALSGMDYSPSDLSFFLPQIRNAGFSHAILVMDKKVTSEKTKIWLKEPVFDYLSLQTEEKELQKIVRSAFRWSQTQGERMVFSFLLRQKWESLDEGMKNVLRLLYSGDSNRDISEKLSLSARTVESRRARLMETFGVHSFAELIRVATEFMDEDNLPPSIFMPSREEKESVSSKTFSKSKTGRKKG